eukprot:SAG11_NODE_2540_length_3240_cov_5.748886_6_plen_117_part_00
MLFMDRFENFLLNGDKSGTSSVEYYKTTGYKRDVYKATGHSRFRVILLVLLTTAPLFDRAPPRLSQHLLFAPLNIRRRAGPRLARSDLKADLQAPTGAPLNVRGQPVSVAALDGTV